MELRLLSVEGKGMDSASAMVDDQADVLTPGG
jgi:hypothetical protein